MENSDSVFIGVHHVGLTVTDADAARRFYSTAAAFEDAPDLDQRLMPGTPDVGVGKFMRGVNANLRIIKAQPSSGMIARAAGQRPVSEAGITHVCLQSTRLDALYKNFQSAGATFHAPPVDLGTGFLYSYARDFEANVVELEGTAPVWDDPTPWLAHVSFSSADRDRLTNFYATLLGQSAIKSSRLGPNSKLDLVSGLAGTEFMAAWIPAGNMQVEVIQYLQPPTLARTDAQPANTPGYQYLCFEVTDVAVAAARARDAGATQSDDMAAMSGRNQYHCTDPDGNRLVLMALDATDSDLSINALSDPGITARLLALREASRSSKFSKQKASSL